MRLMTECWPGETFDNHRLSFRCHKMCWISIRAAAVSSSPPCSPPTPLTGLSRNLFVLLFSIVGIFVTTPSPSQSFKNQQEMVRHSFHKRETMTANKIALSLPRASSLQRYATSFHFLIRWELFFMISGDHFKMIIAFVRPGLPSR